MKSANIKFFSILLSFIILNQCYQPSTPQQMTKETAGCQPQIDSEGNFIWGCSVGGHQLKGLKLGKGPKNVIFLGNIHGSHECNTYTLVQKIADYFKNNPAEIPAQIKLYFMPSINPDGCQGARTRTNANNVDLNRNWDTPNWQKSVYPSGNGGSSAFSEPETRSLAKLILSIKNSSTQPLLAISYHSQVPQKGAVQPAYTLQAGTPLLNDLAEKMSLKFAKTTGYEYLSFWTYYEITGEFINWAGLQGISAWDVELTDGLNTAAAINNHFNRNLPAIKNLLHDFAVSPQ